MLHVWYIDLQNWVIFRVNVGKYSSTMEHIGEAGWSRSWPHVEKSIHRPGMICLEVESSLEKAKKVSAIWRLVNDCNSSD